MKVGRIAQLTHTPGPWGIEQTDDTNWIGPLRRTGDGKVTDVVCSTDREGLKPDVLARNDANARLLAAAPDLLAALQQIVDESQTGSPYAVDLIRGLARGAIAKAEGREP